MVFHAKENIILSFFWELKDCLSRFLSPAYTKKKSFYSTFYVEKDLFLLPEIHNINASFIQKIYNMNFSFRAKFMFL